MEEAREELKKCLKRKKEISIVENDTQYREIDTTKLFSNGDCSEFESTIVDPDELMVELEILRNNMAKEDAKFLCLDKEKERITMNALFERKALLKRMTLLPKQNKKLEDRSAMLHSYLFGCVGSMKSKIQEYE